MDYAEQPGWSHPSSRQAHTTARDKMSDEAIRHWLHTAGALVESIEDRFVPFPSRGLAVR